MDEIDCTDGVRQQQAWLPEKYNPGDYFREVAKNVDIYNIDKLGPTTGTVFEIFANNNLDVKINTLFDTGAMKSVMSLEMYKKTKTKWSKYIKHSTHSRSLRWKFRRKR